jgi:hypothetical protein
MVARRMVKMRSLPLKFNLAKEKATKIENKVPPKVLNTATMVVLSKYLEKSIFPCAEEL